MIFTQAKLLTSERFINQTLGFSYRYIVSSTEYFRPHYHEYYEIFTLLDGSAIHFVNDKKIKLHKGDMVFIRPCDIHDYKCESGKPFSMMNIGFNTQTADLLFKYLDCNHTVTDLLNNSLPPTVHLNEHELQWFNSNMDSICAIESTETAVLKTELRILLFKLFTKFFFSSLSDNSETPLWLEKLLEEMRQNKNYVYGIERLLKLSGKSREHTLRTIKKYTGMTATEYINSLRVNYIANMLQYSNHNITDIIFESGFNNISWASETFKKRFGITMSEFRKNHK